MMLDSRKSYGKVNICLKVTGQRGVYHEFLSRFMKLENIYDDIEFIHGVQNHFVLEGSFSCTKANNTIYKAYLKLLEYKDSSRKIQEFFSRHKVSVVKRIPEFGGLGGGSSNAATFLHMANDHCRLGLSIEELCQIGSSVGADVPFFLYNIESANVMGVGEKVEPFFERALDIKYLTPPNILCSTGDVYLNFRKNHYKELNKEEVDELKTISSREILDTFDARSANDLCASTVELYPDVEKYIKQGWFLTGSGSTVFTVEK